MVADAQRTKDVMEHVLRAFLNRHLKRGLLGWYAAYVDAIRAREMMSFFLNIMIKRNLARGWRHWHDVCLAIEEARERLFRHREHGRERMREREGRREAIRAARAAKLEEQLHVDAINSNRCALLDSKTPGDARANLARSDALEESILRRKLEFHEHATSSEEPVIGLHVPSKRTVAPSLYTFSTSPDAWTKTPRSEARPFPRDETTGTADQAGQ